MRYLTKKELRKMMLSAYERIERDKEEINKINVFPVPDQDTGSNAANTLLGIKKGIEGNGFKDLNELSEKILDSALTAARGNTGVIYTGFLAGFLSAFKNKNPIDAKELAIAFWEGAERAKTSIQNPKEGTILDVINAVARTFKTESEKETDIVKLFRKAIKSADKALLATRDKMEIFRRANVVDSGGLAYLMILESQLEALEKEEGLKVHTREKKERSSDRVKKFIQTISYRYEVVFLVKNRDLDRDDIKSRLAKLGDSLEVLKIGDKTKVHIHTDLPEEVKKVARESGDIQSLRVEDLADEVVGERLERPKRRVLVGIVVDDVAALLPKTLERYQIEVVSTKLNWPELDKIPGENIYQKMREIEKKGIQTLPKTSQATPKDYLGAFKRQLKRFDKVLCISLSSKLSGCYSSAKVAESMINQPDRVFVLDSLHAAASEALLSLRAIELIQEQRSFSSIIREIKNLIPETRFYILFKDPKWIENIGRITKSQANWIRRINEIGLYPIMTLKKGLIAKSGVTLAKDMVEALFKKIEKESRGLRKSGRIIRVVINHADNLEGAQKLKAMLKKENGFEVSFISAGPPIICAATGPGTLIIGWQPI